MLPFLKRKEAGSTGLIIQTRAPDESAREEAETEEKDDPEAAIDACSMELLLAIHTKDIKGFSKAIKALFEILSAQPQEEESDHSSPHSYDAQNIKAGQE